MASWRQHSVVALTIATCAFGAAAIGRAAENTFPCRWNYTLYVGLHTGSDTGGLNADCTGITGRLMLSARLYRSTSGNHTWRLAHSTTHSWTNPSGNRYLEFGVPCTPGQIRAVFTWILTDRSGHLLAHNTITTAPVNDPGPGCKYSLG